MVTYVVSCHYAKTKVDSYYSLPPEKTVIFHKVMILNKSIFNKYKVNYLYNIFLEKALCELSKK